MFQFSSKAETLSRLKNKLTLSAVPESYFFTVAEWESDSAFVVEQVQHMFSGRMVIVRSSALGEDSAEHSQAGMYQSIPNVVPESGSGIAEAICDVIASYSKGRECNPADLVLVQPMISNINMVGVVFTQDLNTGAPYYSINYDDTSGKFDSITAGVGDVDRTLVVRRGAISSISSSRFVKLLSAIQEIEEVTGCDSLDVEFIVDFDEQVHLLQVRPIAVSQHWNRSMTRKVNSVLDEIKKAVELSGMPVYGALGSKAIYGVMPDWNPIEMLGAAPRKLATSLYRYLITDSVWAEARADMGYRDMSGRPLMHTFGGRPYIDVRESFNSFLPASLPDELGNTLVNVWLERLESHPELHDKIEFEVATTIHSPDFTSHVVPGLLSSLPPKSLHVFECSLLELTNTIIGLKEGVLEVNLAKVETLDALLHEMRNGVSTPVSQLVKLSYILRTCKEFGSKPFSVVARCGFIAESFLRGLVNVGALDNGRAEEFRYSIHTVLSDFLEDIQKLCSSELDESEFMRMYGHLRPSSYDILSLRYDQRPATMTTQCAEAKLTNSAEFVLSAEESERVRNVLKGQGYIFGVERLFDFMRKAITGREFAKFQFSKLLSDAIELVAGWGERLGLAREELAHVDIEDILRSATSIPCSESLEDYFRNLSNSNSAEFAVTQALKLPFLLVSPTDIDVAPLLKSKPNYITTNTTQAPVVLLTGHERRLPDLFGKIVLIEGADPGFDWIFAQGIAGLLTKHGGANSHMAIRCAELDLPAAIGCGEQLFLRFQQASEVKIDCASEHITII